MKFKLIYLFSIFFIFNSYQKMTISFFGTKDSLSSLLGNDIAEILNQVGSIINSQTTQNNNNLPNAQNMYSNKTQEEKLHSAI